MRYKLWTIAFLALAAAYAQSRFQAPVIGVFVDADKSVRPVHGVAGAFVVREAHVAGGFSALASRSSCLVKTATEVLAFDLNGNLLSHQAAPAGEALFAFDEAGAPLAVFTPGNKELRRWWRGQWRVIPLDSELLAGEMISMASMRENVIGFVVRDDGEYWIRHVSLWTGRVLHDAVLPGVREPLTLLGQGRLLFGRAEGLALRSAEGAESIIDLGGAAISLEPMSPDWVRVKLENRAGHFAVAIAGEQLGAYRLPEAPR